MPSSLYVATAYRDGLGHFEERKKVREGALAPNERLRKAMAARHVTAERLAELVEVDPKTVGRWLSGRTPHTRHRWVVSEVLGQAVDDLWPSIELGSPGSASDEVIAAFPRRADVAARQWVDLVRQSQSEIGFLGYAMLHLPEQIPDFTDLIRERAEIGCRVRIALADPDSDEAQRRDAEEQLNGGLIARIRTATYYFSELDGIDNVKLGFHHTPMYNSIFRFDDHMLVTPHLFGVAGSRAPLFHLLQRSDQGVFDRFASHFESIWAEIKPFEDRR